ncbi:hypothetical protein [Microbacterium rhizophilus]|uniref:hypothetical protein n=1 Tax=Microbacterium rhizophilus TaxID=3138934 RepID=UPI0031E63061
MSARNDLAALIAIDAPESWAIYPYPVNLGPFEDPAKSVALVVEQTSIASGVTSSDGERIPVEAELHAWIVVDGSRGDQPDVLEARLEEALEHMIRALNVLPDHVWDGRAERAKFDQSKPAYRVTVKAPGHITEETS